MRSVKPIFRKTKKNRFRNKSSKAFRGFLPLRRWLTLSLVSAPCSRRSPTLRSTRRRRRRSTPRLFATLVVRSRSATSKPFEWGRRRRPRADARAHQVLAVPLGKAPAVAAAAAVAVLVAPVFVGRVSVLAARAEGRKRHTEAER